MSDASSSMRNDSEFPEGCAIVFGGSGGLGRAIALLLSRRGCNVAVTYRGSKSAAVAVEQEIVADGGGVWVIRCDVLDEESVTGALDDARERFGSIHTIVTAFGSTYQARPFMQAGKAKYREMLDTDVIGFFNVAHCGIPLLRAAGGGAIVALTATTVRRAFPNQTESITPKLALTGLCTQIAMEEGANGIRVNTVGPGLIAAGMAISMMETGSREFLERAQAMTPMRRMGTANEVAEAVAFLASNRASFITGQHLMVDGGLTAG